MNTRNRQVQFPNPFNPDDIDFDPERALWVPGRKKIFLPAPKDDMKWTLGIDWNAVQEGMKQTLLQMDFTAHYLYDSPICVPGRGGYLGIDRSVVPQFSSRRNDGDTNRDNGPAIRRPSENPFRIPNYRYTITDW